MKTHKIILAVLNILVLVPQTGAEENHWQVIKQLWQEDKRERSTKSRRYLESLSADDLLIAARQCAEEIEQRLGPEDWDMAIMDLGFFYQYYPGKTDNLKNIEPLLNDLKDRSQSLFWRRAIMQFLVSWRGELNAEQSFDAASIVKTILADMSEPMHIRIKAARESASLFRKAYDWNLHNDPNVKQLIAAGKKYDAILRDIKNGRIKLANETVQMHKQIKVAIVQSIQSQLAIFSEDNISTELRGKLIATLAELRGYDSTGRIKQAMSDALKNYKNYDEKLWQQLVRTNIVYFQNEEAESILHQMIDEAKNEHVRKEHLIWFKKRLDKGKVERMPTASSFIKIPKPKPQPQPVVAEPVDVNELVK